MPTTSPVPPAPADWQLQLNQKLSESGSRSPAFTKFVNDLLSQHPELRDDVQRIVRAWEDNNRPQPTGASAPTNTTPDPAATPSASLAAAVLGAAQSPTLNALVGRGTQVAVGAILAYVTAHAGEASQAFQRASGGDSVLRLFRVTSPGGLLVAAGALGLVASLLNGLLAKHLHTWPMALTWAGRRVVLPGWAGCALAGTAAAVAVVWLAGHLGLGTPAAAGGRENLLTWPVAVLALGAGFAASHLLTATRDRQILLATTKRGLEVPSDPTTAATIPQANSVLDVIRAIAKALGLTTGTQPQTTTERLKALGVPTAWLAAGAAVVGLLVQGLGSGQPTFLADPPIAPIYPPDELIDGKPFHWEQGQYVGLPVGVAPADLTLDAPGAGRWVAAGQFRAAWSGPAGSAYYVDRSLQMDDKFLCVGAHVGDLFPLRSTKRPDSSKDGGWAGGALQLRLATDPERGATIGPDYPPDRLYHLTLWSYAGHAYLHIARGLDFARPVAPIREREVPPDPRLERFDARFEPDADGRGYVVKARIPWHYLGLDAAPYGRELGLCWETTWADEKGDVCIGKLTDVLNAGELDRVRRGALPAPDPRPGKISYQVPAIWGKAVCAPKP